MFLQSEKIPSNRSIPFHIKDFGGGLNNVDQLRDINEASNILNFAFVDNNLLETRPGTGFYDDLEFDSPILFIDEYDPYSGEKTMVRATSDEIYFGNEKLMNVLGAVRGTNYMGYYWFVDGGAIYVYGTFPQEEDTFTSFNESTAISTPTIMKLVNPPEGYESLPAEYVKGVTVFDYDVGECWYEPCINEEEDPYKGHNVIPENPTLIVQNKGRMFLSGSSGDDDNVFITDMMNGFYFPVWLPIQMPPNTDKIVGMEVFHDSIIVGRKNDVHVIYGVTNRLESTDLFRLKKINSHTGWANNDTVIPVHNYLYYLGSDGIVYSMYTTHTDVTFLTTKVISKQKIDFLLPPLSFTFEDMGNASAIFYDDCYWLKIKDRVLVYYFSLQSWVVFEFQGFNVEFFYKQGTDLLFGTDIGRVVKYGVDGYSDLGEPYLVKWHSTEIDMGVPSTYKQFRELYVVANVYDDYDSVFKIAFDIDYVEIKDLINIQSAVSRWGVSEFGDRFLAKNIVASLPVIIGQRGRVIKIKITNNINLGTPVQTYSDLSVYGETKSGVVVKVLDEDEYYFYCGDSRVWKKKEPRELYYPIKVYEVNGEYELRGKR